MAKIKKRKSLGTIGDVEYVMNVPMGGFRDEATWREELRLTYIAVVQKAYDFGSRHFDVFKAGINVLSYGANDLQKALGHDVRVTEDEYFDLDRMRIVPERLWPLLAVKLSEALAGVTKEGPQPRHIVCVRWTAEALEAMKIDLAEGDFYSSLENDPRSNSMSLLELIETRVAESLRDATTE